MRIRHRVSSIVSRRRLRLSATILFTTCIPCAMGIPDAPVAFAASPGTAQSPSAAPSAQSPSAAAPASSANATATAQGTVVTYPIPVNPDVEASHDYTVTVDGQPVGLYKDYVDQYNKNYWGDGASNYAHGSFDFSGTVTVKVTAPKGVSLAHTVIQPVNLHITPQISGQTLTFTLTRPCNVSVEPDGIQHPLLLFANPIQNYRVNLKAKNVIDIPPGYWAPGDTLPGGTYTIPKDGIISLHSNQTLYVEGGAVVKAAVQAKGNNIKILGRGILETVRYHGNFNWQTFKDENGFGHLSGPMNVFQDCTNFLMDGVTVRWPTNWTLTPARSRNVTFNNVKIVGGASENDDGIDPVSSQNVTVKHCFIRTDDDCMDPNGDITWGPPEPLNNIQVYDNVFWSDRARVFYTGWEDQNPSNTNMHVYNDDIIHYMGSVIQFEPTMQLNISHYTFENLRVYGTGYSEAFLIRFDPTYIDQGTYTKYGSGSASYILFKNITFYDASKTAGLVSAYVPFVATGSTISHITFDHVQFLKSTDQTISFYAEDILHHPIHDLVFKHVWMDGNIMSSPSEVRTSKGVTGLRVTAN